MNEPYAYCAKALMLATVTARLTLYEDWIKPYEQPRTWIYLLKMVSRRLSLQIEHLFPCVFFASSPAHTVNEKFFLNSHSGDTTTNLL